MTNKVLIKELRCLRMHLSPLLPAEKINVLEEAERRLEKNGAVSTDPAQSSSNVKKRPKPGVRSPKKEAFNRYYYK